MALFFYMPSDFEILHSNVDRDSLAMIDNYHLPRENASYLLASEGFWPGDKF